MTWRGDTHREDLALREPYRTPCRLMLLEQHTAAEAASLCGRPQKTVEAQIYRAKENAGGARSAETERRRMDEKELELFREDGCLTDAGFRAMMDGQLDELGRLEAAEHLSYCDQCMDRYTALLTADALEQPPRCAGRGDGHDLGSADAEYLWQGAVAGVAAVLALTLWRSGALQQILTVHGAGRETVLETDQSQSGNPAGMTRPRRTPRNTAPLRTTGRRPRRNSWGDPWRQNRTAAMRRRLCAPQAVHGCDR